MKRIVILGCSGAGKSTLARMLGERLSLPVIHLDQHYWRPGWIEPAREEWRVQALELVGRPAWVMDGNYSITFPERFAVADMVVLFDFPTWLCLWRVMKRTVTQYGTSRADMPQGCPERFDATFLRYVARFRSVQRPKLISAVSGYAGPKHILSSPAEVEHFLATIPSSPLPAASAAD